MKVLITGGTGYIGSHTIIEMIATGNYTPLCVDSCERSTPKTIERIKEITGITVPFYQLNICNKETFFQIFEEHKDIIGIIHFAAYKSVPESVEKPLEYYRNNLQSLENVLEACLKYNIQNLIFSSSCSIYGAVEKLPINEDTPMGFPFCPYAHTKQIGEDMIRFFTKIHPQFNTVILRYFNPVGAHSSGLNGELSPDRPNNLMPIITQVGIGKMEKLTVFGTDYATRDGSCIRDYVHVSDIADAHIKAMELLIEKKNKTNCEVFNLGSGNGVSVLEMIHSFEEITGVKLNYIIGERRSGDVPAVYSDSTRAIEILEWKCKKTLVDMVESAWKWEQHLKHYLFFLFFLFSSFFSVKTQTITLNDCVQQALEANYEILIAKNSENISRINLKSYSVFLPVIYGDANHRSNYFNTTTKDAEDIETNYHNNNILNANAGVNLNWRIFDGLSMFFTHAKNKALLDISTLNTVLEVEKLISNVCAAYYNVWVQTKLMKASENIVDISIQRFNIANSKYQIGSISGLEYRQSKIDLNADSSVLMLQQQALTNAYISLNKLMNSDLTKENYIQDTLSLLPLFNYKEIVDSALQSNTSFLIYKKGIKLSELNVKNSLAQFFPTLDFATGYQFTNAKMPISNTIQTQSHGFYWGFTARIPIFSRMETLRNNRIAKYQLQNAELQYKDLELNVLSALAELYNIYKNNHQLLNFEMENVEITSETLEIAIEKYRIGSLSGVEFREFQRSYIEAVKRLMNASFQAKVSEIGLQLLSGKLK